GWPIVTSDDAGGKRAPGNSGSVLGQEDRQEHQQEGQTPKAGESTKILGQSAVGHDANSPAAGSGQASEQAQRGQREQHVRPLRDWNGLVAIATTALAVIGVGGLFFTAFQLGAMRDQLEEMRKANRLTEKALSAADRAWIFPVVTITSPLQENQNFEVTVTLQNSGHTPALHTKADVGLTVQPSSEAPQYNHPGYVSAEMIAYPGSQLTAKSTLESKAMTEDLVKGITSGALTLYATGIITYMDVNSVPHRSQLCNFYDLPTKLMTACKLEGSNVAD
ncbi:MAG: hypothetical protein INR62_11125, partial [Rhodospirillales bacterium]|nr:hypothetical protein [Acetobacter sp.]